MIHYISIYAILGVCINLLYDLMISGMDSDPNSEDFRMTIGERIIFGLIWPISLTFFIISFINLFRD
jgi:hypothetical protein